MKSIVPHLVTIDDLVVIVDKNYKRMDVIFYARFKLFCHLSFISSPNKVVSSSCFLSRFGLRYVEARCGEGLWSGPGILITRLMAQIARHSMSLLPTTP